MTTRFRPVSPLLAATCAAALGGGVRPAAAQVVGTEAEVPVVVATVEAAPGGRAVVPVTVDLGPAGKALGSYQARVRFDAASLRLVSSTNGDFEGPAVVNAERAGEGVVTFAGANPDARRNLGATRIVELVFEALGGAGTRSVVRVEVAEIVAAGDFTRLTSRTVVKDGAVVVPSAGPDPAAARPARGGREG